MNTLSLQACGFDTTSATVGNWYLRVAGSSTPAARFRCPGPSLGYRRTSIPENLHRSLNPTKQRRSGSPTSVHVDSGPSSAHLVCYQVAAWCSEDETITRNSKSLGMVRLDSAFNSTRRLIEVHYGVVHLSHGHTRGGISHCDKGPVTLYVGFTNVYKGSEKGPMISFHVQYRNPQPATQCPMSRYQYHCRRLCIDVEHVTAVMAL